jgi:ppGpp synthetase/RelA/SpoT-type nucleotidyltranferase
MGLVLDLPSSVRSHTAAAVVQWLDVSSHCGAMEAAIFAMTKKSDLPYWGSKGAVNRAGEAIRAKAVTEGHALVLESWRIAHRNVIHTFEALLRARAKNKDVEVAQRLKRRYTIVDKLSRFPRMELARMDDVAGCRLIFQNIEVLHEFRDKVQRAKFLHVLRNAKDKYDYIEVPTDRGYRGIHDVYEYRAKKGKSKRYNGLLIEIQYRTQLQHAWATAVEVVTQMTENEPKFDRGDRRHIRFFCLASEILARTNEDRKSCLPSLSDRELIEEFENLNDEINVMTMLIDLDIHKWIDERARSKHVILHIPKKGELKLHSFDLELEASKALLELEKTHPEDDIVLVGADTVAEITSAFRNYFKDVREFLRLMHNARTELTENSKWPRKLADHEKATPK